MANEKIDGVQVTTTDDIDDGTGTTLDVDQYVGEEAEKKLEEQVQQTDAQTEDDIWSILEETGIGSRYNREKYKDDKEVVQALAKTVANGDEKIRKMELQQQLWQLQMQQQQAQAQRYEAPPDYTPQNDQIAQAEKFVEDTLKKLSQKSQMTSEQQQQYEAAQAEQWALHMAANDNNFDEAYRTGGLQNKFQQLLMTGRPYNRQTAELAWTQFQLERTSQNAANVAQTVQERAEAAQRMKQKAFVENGGIPKRTQLDPYSELQRKSKDMSADQLAEAIQRLKEEGST